MLDSKTTMMYMACTVPTNLCTTARGAGGGGSSGLDANLTLDFLVVGPACQMHPSGEIGRHQPARKRLARHFVLAICPTRSRSGSFA